MGCRNQICNIQWFIQTTFQTANHKNAHQNAQTVDAFVSENNYVYIAQCTVTMSVFIYVGRNIFAPNIDQFSSSGDMCAVELFDSALEFATYFHMK